MPNTTVEAWANTLLDSLERLWFEFVDFIPTILGALIVFLVAWIVGVILGKVTVRVLQTIQADRAFDQVGVMKHLHNAGVQWEFSSFVGAVVRWFFIIAGFMAAVEILGLSEVSNYIRQVLEYIPNVIVAALILLVAAVLANFLERVVVASMRTTAVGPAAFVGLVVRWSVWGFAILAALTQLEVAADLVRILFMGLVAMLALAGGLAFGLGGQNAAREVIDDVRREAQG